MTDEETQIDANRSSEPSECPLEAERVSGEGQAAPEATPGQPSEVPPGLLRRTGASKTSKARSPLYAIRQKCLDCSGGEGSFNAVKYCPCTDCSLWRFRFGVSPDTATRRWPDLMDPAKMPSPDEYRDKYAR